MSTAASLVRLSTVTPQHPTLDYMATDTSTEREQRTQRQILPPWRVMLHNDDVNDMMHVVKALMKSVSSLTIERATEIMIEAHMHGVAQVIICPKEHAEMYRERLEQQGLTSTIEPA